MYAEEQVEKAGPRVAAMRAACKKHERDIAALCAQLAAAGMEPALAPASARSAHLVITSRGCPLFGTTDA